MKKRLFLLLAIIFLAVVLRVYQLSHVPPSASLDEASIGWNAYSILNTGADEYGYKFPILLRAYDDWRPALYVYLVIPFIKLLGLSVIAVRLPSVILEIFAILATYFLVKELFEKYKYKEYLGLLSAFFLSISPWSVYISRLGHEANAGFAFGIFAIFFFLKFKNSLKNIYLYLAVIFFSISFYAYQAEKIFIPLIVIILAVLFREKLLARKKHLLFATLLGLVILIPVLKETLSPNGLARFRGTSAFDVNAPVYFQAAKIRLSAKENHNLLKEVLNNNRIVTLKIFTGNYISHFSPYFLFANSGLGDFRAPKVGLLYLFELPLIIIGIFYLLFGKFDRKVKIFLAGWIIISPLAASIASGSPHAMRSYNFLPTFQILSSLGLIYLVVFIKKGIARNIFMFIVLFIVIVNVLYFCRQYFISFPKEQSSSFQYTMSVVVPYILRNQNSFDEVIISNRNNLAQSYMLFLFYSKYDPILYQNEGGTVTGGFEQTHKFGNYKFKDISLKKISRGVLYLGNPSESPLESDKFFVVKNFTNLDGKISAVAFYIK